jgi:UDP-glucose 4-epimerase
MATTLITGGLGFLGSHLADHLLEHGERVVVIDDLSTGSAENLAHHAHADRLEIFIGSVLDEQLMQQLVGRVDRVFHFAAAVGVGLVASEPVRVHETNTVGTSLVLKACAAWRCPVLLASTSEVYGKSSRIPFAEDDDLVFGPTVRRRWAYACSKATGEFLGQAYFTTQGLPVRIARFFNAAGPRQTGAYGMVIPRFVQQAIAGEPITVYGDGSQSRCFCHAREAVRAAALLMDSPAAGGEVVNIGGTEIINIMALAGLVRDLTGSDSPIVQVPLSVAYPTELDDLDIRKPDIRKLERLTGFVPTCTLAEIIEEIIPLERERGAAA